jgi:hypothetical protein
MPLDQQVAADPLLELLKPVQKKARSGAQLRARLTLLSIAVRACSAFAAPTCCVVPHALTTHSLRMELHLRARA